MKTNYIENIDVLVGYEKVKPLSIDLQIIDPPYFSTNIKEVGDNQWRKESEYLEWMKVLLTKAEKSMKYNGSIYLFHNDCDLMIDLLYYIKHDLGLFVQNQITWNKFTTHNNFSRVIKTFGSNRKYGKTFTEKIYFITKQKNYFETPFSKIILKAIDSGISRENISKLEVSKNGNKTGWLFNKIKGTQIPTEQQWNKICKFLNIENNYETLLKIFKEERYRFNQPYIDFSGKNVLEQKEILKPYSEIWEYQKDLSVHPTKKPDKMIENIIKISTNKNDIVLDPMFGSGVSIYSAKKLNRKYIGFENSKKYFDELKKLLKNK